MAESDLTCQQGQSGERYHATRHGIVKHLQSKHAYAKEQQNHNEISEGKIEMTSAVLALVQIVISGSGEIDKKLSYTLLDNTESRHQK